MNEVVLIVVFISSVAYIFGGFSVLFKKNWNGQGLFAITALSAGLLLSIAILDLIPDTQEDLKNNCLYVLLGFILMYFIQQLSKMKKDSLSSSSITGISVGMMLHNLFEGLSIGISYTVNMHLGIVVTIALILHKIPEGLAFTSTMLAASGNRKRISIYLLIQALFTWLGAGTALLLSRMHTIQATWSAIPLAITAGIFLYLGGTSLLPSVNKQSDRRIPFFFLGGILLYFVFHGISEALS